jgi:DNA-binding PadR family transcriptional regulator
MMETILSDAMFNPNKRRPKLRMEILELIAIDGKMSVSKAESSLNEKHHHPDVWHAFKNLERKEFIEKRVDRNPGKGKLMGKGRQQIYYKITERGLRVLIRDYDKIMEKVIDPQTFWRAMITFCYNSTKEIRLDKVEEFYELFLGKYLKYSSGHGYFQLDQFNQMCDNWIQYRILPSNRITLDQIVLEILAMRPGITLDELANMVTEAGVTREQIEKTISDYTPIPHKPAWIDANGNLDSIEYNKTDWHFQLHKTIVIRVTVNDLYELSLFGILLVQSLVHNREIGKLKHGLYYNDISFENYHDKIASNYQSKLPLVFGKWNLLKRILNIMSAHNFGIILDRQTRSDIMARSSLEGGNKEFYDSVVGVALHSQTQLSELCRKGMMEWSNYITSAISEHPDKSATEASSFLYRETSAVFQMLLKINILLDPSAYDPVSFQDLVKKQAIANIIDSKQAEQLSRLFKIDIIEKAFAEEITFLYFLNLHNNYRFQVVLPIKHYNQVKPKDMASFSPMQCLLAILRHDKQIRERFSAWIQDLGRYQEEILRTIYDFQKMII